jgi:hypothetical protein
MSQWVLRHIGVPLRTGVALLCPGAPAGAQTEPLGGQPSLGLKPSVADLDYQVKYQRAFEAVMWAVPAVAIHGFSKGIESLGLRPNDIAAFGRLWLSLENFRGIPG